MNIVLDSNLLLHYKPFEEIAWEEELGSKDNTLTHGLQSKAFEFYVDAATCDNFKMNWIIVDSALIEPVKGVLNVSFSEEC